MSGIGRSLEKNNLFGGGGRPIPWGGGGREAGQPVGETLALSLYGL